MIYKKYLWRNNRGFTLVEIILALALIGSITIGILPMFTFGIHGSINGKRKFVATNIATSQIEWLKTLDYNSELGLAKKNYKPYGIVDESLFMNKTGSNPLIIDGTEYKIRTKIYWEAAKSYTQQEIVNATKKVEVTVFAINPINKSETKYAMAQTLFSFEGQRDPSKPGNLKIYSLRHLDKPQRGVCIEALGPLVQYAYTDASGKAILSELLPGNYTVTPKSWGVGEMMIRPLGVTGVFPNQSWKENLDLVVPIWDPINNPTYPEHTFFVDFPARLQLPRNYIFPEGAKIMVKPSSESFTIPEGEHEDFMTLTLPLNKINTTNLWWDWQYIYSVIDGEDQYLITDKDTSREWDGRFKKPISQASIQDIILNIPLADTGNLSFINNEESGKKRELIVVELEFGARVKEVRNIVFQFQHQPDMSLDREFGYYSSKEELLNLDEEGRGYSTALINPLNGHSKKMKIYIYDPKDSLGLKTDTGVDPVITIMNYQDIKNCPYQIELANYKNEARLVRIP